MKIILQAHSNNDYWDANFILVELNPELVATLREQARRAQLALVELGATHFGSVKLDSPVTFTVGDAPEITDQWEDEPWLIVPEDFELPEAARIECHAVQYMVAQDSMWLTAISKDSPDTVEAELTPALLDMVQGIEGSWPPAGGLQTPDSRPKT